MYVDINVTVKDEVDERKLRVGMSMDPVAQGNRAGGKD
jgi:hypothetical protein